MVNEIIADGYNCVAGSCKTHWYAAVNILEDHDRQYTEDIVNPCVDGKVELLPGKNLQEWENASVAQSKKLLFIEETEEGTNKKILTEAEQISEPAIPKDATVEPVITWCEKNNQKWVLKFKNGEVVKNIYETSQMLRSPAIVFHQDTYLMAVEMDEEDETVITIFTEEGEEYFTVKGRKPVLASSGSFLYVVSEVSKTDISEIELHLTEVNKGTQVNDITLKSGGVNINCDMVFNSEARNLSVVWESTPYWKDPFVGKHRDINYLTLEPGDIDAGSSFKTGEKIDVSQEAPVNPCLTIRNCAPVLFFKSVNTECRFGWDTYLTVKNEQEWSPARKVSEKAGAPDSKYTILFHNDRVIGFLPVCDSKPTPTCHRAYNHRLEIKDIKENIELSEHSSLSVHATGKANCQIPDAMKNIASEPPEIKADSGYKLIWGDIHLHSNLSKCKHTIDGSPNATLRFARDILGCQVLTLTDHTHKQGAAEFAWHLDKLEEAAGDRNIVLYSSEPGLSSGHHTNFYAIDRKVFERLRLTGISEHDREKIYSIIKQEFPEGSVLALRHFHGRCKDRFDSIEAASTWDPELEIAMEAMQIRGDALMGRLSTETSPPYFPGNFLNSGAEIGLVGGSDHGPAPDILNHFALTGFWVEDFSAEAVWEALKNRRTIACSNGKIAIWAELNGSPMGSKVKVLDDVVKIKTIIKSPRSLKRICLIKDGQPIKWTEIDGDSVETILEDDDPTPGKHWYSVTAEGTSAFQKGSGPDETVSEPSVLAHSSPFFVDIEK